MELEARVSTLEQELKVLKNEIQNVLLEIQEFLLSATYPALSGEGNVVEGDTSEVATATPVEQNAAPTTSGVSDTNGHASTKASWLLTALGEEMPTPTAKANPAPRARSQAGEPNLGALMAWVTKSVERLGKTRTQQLLALWAESGHLPERWVALLQQLIAMSNAQDEPDDVPFQDMAQLIVELEQLLGPATNNIEGILQLSPR